MGAGILELELSTDFQPTRANFVAFPVVLHFLRSSRTDMGARVRVWIHDWVWPPCCVLYTRWYSHSDPHIACLKISVLTALSKRKQNKEKKRKEKNRDRWKLEARRKGSKVKVTDAGRMGDGCHVAGVGHIRGAPSSAGQIINWRWMHRQGTQMDLSSFLLLFF